MTPLVIFGTGMFAEMLHFYFTTDSDYKVVGFTVDRSHMKDSRFCGLPVVPFEEVEHHFMPETHEMCAAIGYSKGHKFIDVLETRKRKYAEALQKNYQLARYISSKSIVCHPERIGRNSIVMEGCGLMPFTTVGNNVILYAWCGTGHHSTIEDHVFMAGDITIGGTARIKEGSFISIGSIVSNNVTIGRQSFLGIGSIVTSDTSDEAVYTAGSLGKLRRMQSSKLRL